MLRRAPILAILAATSGAVMWGSSSERTRDASANEPTPLTGDAQTEPQITVPSDPDTCYRLAHSLMAGGGSVQRALSLLKRSAEGGVTTAAVELGELYEQGTLVPQDSREALKWYKKAAERRSEVAQFDLGALYVSGRGIDRDFVEGLAWLIIATDNGAPPYGEREVREYLGSTDREQLVRDAETRASKLSVYLKPDVTPRSFTHVDATTVTVQRGAARFSATKGIVGGTTTPIEVARLRATPPDVGDKVAKYLRSNKDPGPPVKLVTPRQTILSWPSLHELELEAAVGNGSALWALAQVLLDGELVTADEKRAVELLEKGAKAGSADAAYKLGELYSAGKFVSQDDKKAFTLYLQAARGRVRPALYNVGASYVNGRGVERNIDEGFAWLIAAKKVDIDPGAELRIRLYLERNDPQRISPAEKRASEIQRETGLLDFVSSLPHPTTSEKSVPGATNSAVEPRR